MRLKFGINLINFLEKSSKCSLLMKSSYHRWRINFPALEENLSIATREIYINFLLRKMAFIKENFWEGGPTPGGYYNFGYSMQGSSGPTKHTLLVC